MKKAFMLIAVALQSCPVLMAQGDNEHTRETLKGLTGVLVLLEPLDPEIVKDGLSENQVHTDVKLKPRMSGIKVLTIPEWTAAPGRPCLLVTLTMLKNRGLSAYLIEISLGQNVALARDAKIRLTTPTWRVEGVRIVGPDKIASIRDDIKDRVDKFINAYLSVNPKSRGCLRKRTLS